jgi:hypothetical protein
MMGMVSAAAAAAATAAAAAATATALHDCVYVKTDAFLLGGAVV